MNARLWNNARLMLLIVVLLVASIPLRAVEAADTNVALGKDVTASSSSEGSSPTSVVVDGDLSTDWSSDGNNTPLISEADPQWLQVDLGGQYTINQWVVYCYYDSDKEDDNRCKDATLEGSNDGTSFTPIDSVNDSTQDPDTEQPWLLKIDRSLSTPATYQYFRVSISEVGQDSGNFMIVYEFELFGVPASSEVDAETPSIGTQPADKTVNVGESSTLSVAASVSDGGTLSYQWYSNTMNSNSGGTLIDDATSASYSAPTSTAGTTYYYVVVTNTNSAATGATTAEVTSSAANVTVNALVDAETPSIGTQPADKTVNVGESATLSVAASVSDGGSLTYQWYSNTTNSNSGGTLINDATSASYSAPTSSVGTTYYYVVVTNTNSAVTGAKTAEATSSAAKVTVNALVDAETPSIGTQPADKTVNVGESATLSVVASVSDDGTLSYQWYSNTTNSNSGGTLIDDATSASYAAPTSIADTTYYYVVVTNTNSDATGAKTATKTSNAAKVTVNALVDAETPSIGTQPSDKTVNVGESATLSVAASVSDGGTLSYQWYSNTTNSNSGGTLIDEATSASYSAPTSTADTTYYYVVVTNTNVDATGAKTATTTSSAAKVTVNVLVDAETPSIGTQPADKTVNVGGLAVLSVAATVSDGGSLTYQWYSSTTNSNSGGTLIDNATSASYSAPTSTAGTTYYYVVVTNTNVDATGAKTATTTSSAAKVTVNELFDAETPSIGTQPSDKTVNVGDTTTLSVVASVSDGGTLSYQWYSNTTNSNSGGTLIGDATSASYEAPTSTAGTTYYYVVVTNTNSDATGATTAEVTSSAAKVTVNVLIDAETPSIGTQPADKTVNVGGLAVLSVAATVSDGGWLTYKWYSNTTNSNSGGTLIGSATTSNLVAPTSTAGTTYYYVVVTNTNNDATGATTAEVTSSAAKVTVNALVDAETPSIGTQPADKTVTVGESATLSVEATVSDGGTLSYQWYSNYTNSNSGGELIDGATSATLAAPTIPTGTMYYYVVVANTNNEVTGEKTVTATSSTAKVTVNALFDAEAPSLLFQTSEMTVNVGDNATLNVGASVSDGGTLSYQWYSNTENSNFNGTLITGATSASYTVPTNTPGTTYYYVVITNTNNAATGDKTATAKNSAIRVTVNGMVNAQVPSIETQPTDKTVNVGGTATLNVAATVSDGGTLSYQWYSSTTNSNSIGTLLLGETSASYTAPTSTAGTKYYFVIVTNTNNAATGAMFAIAKSNAVKVTVNAPTTTESPPPQTSTPSESAQTTGVDVLVNGKVESAGTATTSKVNDQTVTTISVDQKKLEDKLASEGERAVVTIPINTGANVVVGELNGQMVKNMESKQAVLELKTEQATYTLPAQQINIDAVSDQLGGTVALQDIKVQIEIAEPSNETVKVVENAAEAGSFTLVVPPLNFNIKGTYGDKTIEVSKFNAYVERTVAIPDGIDPSKITTGVVVEPDGTVRHVPTKVVLIDGRYYAKINSLTNSTYSVVWHPLEFSDVADHWAKAAVNDMGSRMVIDGTGNGIFNPDQSITRAEFTAIVVRGLGLRLNSEGKPFSDVQGPDWYNSAINAAHEYHLITGFGDGEFRPNDRLTREEAVVILARAMKLTSLLPTSDQSPEDTLLAYTDAADVSSWAQSSMAACVQAGIITGKPGMKLAPTDDISRAEVAAMVQRLLQKANLI